MGWSRVFSCLVSFAPSGACLRRDCGSPTTYVVGCILSPLRGWTAGFFQMSRPVRFCHLVAAHLRCSHCTIVTSAGGGICIKMGDAELAQNRDHVLAVWAGALYIAGAGRGSIDCLRSRWPAFGKLRARSFGKFGEGSFEARDGRVNATGT